MKKIFTFILLLAILSACSPSSVPASEMPVVRYATFSVYDAVYVAQELGYFKDAGIKVEIVGTNFGGPTAIQAVASGKAEGGLSSYMALINAAAAGLPVKAAVEIQSELQDSPKEIFLTRCADGYKSVKDLAGKTIAINLVKSSFHYTWIMALKQNNMTDDSVLFVNLPFSAQPEALHKGDVQAAGIIEPFATLAEKKYPNEFCRLFTGKDVFGYRQFSAIFLNSIWAKEHPETAAAFVNAVQRAEVWSNGNTEQSKQIIANALNIANPADMPNYKFNADGRVDVDSVKYWLDFMKSEKYITADWLTLEDIIWTKNQ